MAISYFEARGVICSVYRKNSLLCLCAPLQYARENNRPSRLGVIAYLKTEQKFSKDDKSVILKNQFMYGMTLVGLALINNHKTRSNSNGAEENKSDADIESTIKTVTASLSPVMLPMIYSFFTFIPEKAILNPFI